MIAPQPVVQCRQQEPVQSAAHRAAGKPTVRCPCCCRATVRTSRPNFRLCQQQPRLFGAPGTSPSSAAHICPGCAAHHDGHCARTPTCLHGFSCAPLPCRHPRQSLWRLCAPGIDPCSAAQTWSCSAAHCTGQCFARRHIRTPTWWQGFARAPLPYRYSRQSPRRSRAPGIDPCSAAHNWSCSALLSCTHVQCPCP